MSPKHKDPIEQATKLLALLKYVYGFVVAIVIGAVWVALKFNSYDQARAKLDVVNISDSLNNLHIWQLRDNIVDHEERIDSLEHQRDRMRERIRELRKSAVL